MADIMRYLLAVLWIGTLAYGEEYCPPPELIAPCTCDLFWRITCVDIVDMEVFLQVFDRSLDYKFIYFRLFNSSLMYLPASRMAAKKIKAFHLANTFLVTMFDNETVDEIPMESLNVEYVTIQRGGVDWGMFRNLKKLTAMSFINTEIPTIGKNFVDNISPMIRGLGMIGTNTRKIHSTAFANLKELVALEVSNSRLKNLRRSWLSRPSPIMQLAFSGNQIKSLPADLFSDMPKLLKIYLGGNQLTTISEAIFGSVYEQLYQLNMEDDPIVCDCGIRWLLKKSEPTHLKPFPITVTATCGSPDDKKGRNVTSFDYDDYKYCDF